MSDIKDQLIKDSYNYVLQSDLSTGIVYRIGGAIPVNPTFLSGLTINSGFTYSNGTEKNGYVLTTDGTGYAYWSPASAATPSSGVTSITVGNGLSASSSTGAVRIVFTGSTGVSGDYLPLSGGTVTGETIFQSGLTANTISATTYFNLPVSGLTSGAGISVTNNNNNFTIAYTGSTGITGDYLPLSGGTVTGNTIFQSGLTATTIYATNYLNLPKDVFITGGTYGNGVLSLTNNTGYTFTVPGFSTATGSTTNYYGSFSDTTNQSVSAANTATAWSANTTELSNGIYIQNGSKITVSNTAIYEIGYSAQIEKTQGTSADVTIWAEINGNLVDRSSSTIGLVSNSVYQLPFVSYILELNAGDYVEFYFSSPNQYVQITTLNGLTSPTRPVSPSLIIVAKAIGNAVLNNSGDTFVTGFTLNNDTLTLTQNRVGQYSGFTVNLPYLPLTGGALTGALTGTTYYGDGSNLTGISRGGGGGSGGQVYYFNISNTQNGYYEFSTTATTATEQSITVSTGSTETAYIGGFLSPSTLPNITNFPSGILSFYIHAYTNNLTATFDLYCELYKRTTGGIETLLFTSDFITVAGISTIMYTSDGYFSGTTLNSSDRILVKIYATNTSNQTRSITILSQGSQHYSYGITTIPSYIDTYVTGFTYSNNTFTIKQNNNQSDLTQTINSVTGWTINGNLTVTGNTSLQGLTATTVSATTYDNLPPLYQLTGGTYSAGTIDFTNTTGGTSFSVTGLSKYFVTGSTPTGVSLNNGDRWFDTNSGIEVVWVTDSDGSQWIQPIQGNSTPSITGSGTTNKIVKWSNSSGLTNSIISDDGATVTVSGNQKITSGLTYQFNSLVSGDSSGEFLYFDIASTTSQSSLYYYNSSGGWTITDSSSPSSSTGLVAIANNTSPSNDGMLIRGYHKLSYSPSFSTGDKLYISNTTPGQLTNTAPTTTGHVVRIVGYVVDSANSLIYFCPDNTWIEIV
jgi:hypothetical protein